MHGTLERRRPADQNLIGWFLSACTYVNRVNRGGPYALVRRYGPRRVSVALGAMLMMFAVASCWAGEPTQRVRVGAGPSAESRVLAEIYAQALDRVGRPAEVIAIAGDRRERLTALDAGQVDLVAEHTGALLATWNPQAQAGTVSEVTRELNRALPAGLMVADAADGTELSPQVVGSAQYLRDAGIATLTQLSAVCAQQDAGVVAAPDFLSPPGDTPQISGCVFARQQPFTSSAQLRTALLSDQVQVGLFIGAPADADLSGLTTIVDPDDTLRPENVVPLLRKGLLNQQQLTKINYVAGELTTAELIEMMRTVRSGRHTAADAARAWLDRHNL